MTKVRIGKRINVKGQTDPCFVRAKFLDGRGEIRFVIEVKRADDTIKYYTIKPDDIDEGDHPSA